MREIHDIIEQTPWELQLPAFKVFGNLYFVGNRDGASWLLDAGDHLILFDTNYPTMDTLLINSIWSLGFDPAKITDIIHTHGHYDHYGATNLLTHLSHAKTYLGEADVRMFKERPELSYLDHARFSYLELFEADVVVSDGQSFKLGNTLLEAAATPGHCPGATSWFFPVTDGQKTYRVGLHGGAGLNTIEREYREQYGVDWRNDFLSSIDKLMDRKVDIFLGNHTAQNHTEEKLERLNRGDTDAFVDPSEWQHFLRDLRERVVNLIEND